MFLKFGSDGVWPWAVLAQLGDDCVEPIQPAGSPASQGMSVFGHSVLKELFWGGKAAACPYAMQCFQVSKNNSIPDVLVALAQDFYILKEMVRFSLFLPFC